MSRPIWNDPHNEPKPYYAIWQDVRYPVIYRNEVEGGHPSYASHAVLKDWEEWYQEYEFALRRLGRAIIAGNNRRFNSLVAVRSDSIHGLVRVRLLEVLETFG